MAVVELHGVCPIAAVPFGGDGSVDLVSFGRLIDHLVGEDVGGVTLFGLASEFYKLTDREREQLRDAFLERTSQTAGVAGIISVTDHSADVAVRRAAQAERAGADVLNLLPPHFLGPSAGAVLEHVERVLDAVGMPVILQYAPVQTGVLLDPADLADVAGRHPNLRWVKVEALPVGPWISRLIRVGGGRILPMVGYAGVQMPDALLRGAVAVQPGCSFVPVYAEVYRRYASGDLEGMADLHGRLLPFISTWMQGTEFIIQVEKTILQRRGLIETEYCRPPAYRLDAGEREMIDRFLGRFGDLLEVG